MTSGVDSVTCPVVTVRRCVARCSASLRRMKRRRLRPMVRSRSTAGVTTWNTIGDWWEAPCIAAAERNPT